MTQVIDLLGYERIAELASAIPFSPRRERFIFVRHGETEGNRTKRYQLPHTPLNETGEGQAALAAKALELFESDEPLRTLRRERLVRVRKTGDLQEIDVYHPRMREILKVPGAQCPVPSPALPTGHWAPGTGHLVTRVQ